MMKTHIQCSDVYLPAGEEGDRDADRDGVTTVNRDGVTANRDGVTADRDGVTADRDGVTTADRDGVTAGSPHLPIQESMPGNCSISSEICIIIYPCNTVYYSMVG